MLSVRRAGQAAIRSGGRTSSGSNASSVKMPRSNGFWLMRNWRKSRSRRSRIETSRPGTPAGSRKSRAARAGGQRAVRLLHHRATSNDPTPRACHGYLPRSGCDVAVLAPPLRQGPSATGFRPARITAPAQKAGQSITRKCNAFGAKKGFECHSAAGTKATAAPPHHRP